MFNIRLATTEDIPAITRIYNEAIEEGGSTADLVPQTFEQRQTWVMSHVPPYAVFVVEEAGTMGTEVVAFGALSVFYDRPGYDGVADLAYYIARDSRRHGIGRAMLGFLIDEARRRGMRKLIAIIFADNAGSTALVTHAGFTRFGFLPAASRSTAGMHDMTYWFLDL